MQQLARAEHVSRPLQQLGLARTVAGLGPACGGVGEAAATLETRGRARQIGGLAEHLTGEGSIPLLLVAGPCPFEALELAPEVAGGCEFAGPLEVLRRLFVLAPIAVILTEDARGLSVLAESSQRLGGTQRVLGTKEEFGRLRMSIRPCGEFCRRRETSTALEHRLRALELAGLLVQLARLQHERSQPFLAARVAAARGARELLGDHGFKCCRGLCPRLRTHERLRGVALKASLGVALACLRVVPAFLEHLRRERHPPGAHEALGSARPLALRGEDLARVVETAGLLVQRRRVGKSILVVPDLGRANELPGLGEQLRRAVEETGFDEKVRGLPGVALLRDRIGLLLDATPGAAIHRPQRDLDAERLAAVLSSLDRAKLLEMATKARSLARPKAAARVADEIEKLGAKKAVKAVRP